MSPLAARLSAYAAYHRDPRNRLTHVVGVPLVTFALLLALGWLRFAPAPDLPISAGTLFYLGVFGHYLGLDWRLAAAQLPLTLPLLVAAEWIARWPFEASVMVFGSAFVGGWVVQLVGHLFEGRRPALADNILQVFNAPLFLTAEVLVRAGYRQDLKAALAGR